MASRSASLRLATKPQADNGSTKPGGRPVRKSAGRKSLPAGYVNLDDAGIDCGSDTSDSDQNAGRKMWKQKPFSHPGPPSPTHLCEFDTSSLDNSPERDSNNHSAIITVPETVSLSFHSPKDHTGPFVVNLRFRDIAATGVADQSAPKALRSSIMKSADNTPRSSRSEHSTGFVHLPPEIRSIIYQQLFIAKKDLTFAAPDFCLSGQFLRTCKIVFLEAAPILYGANTFILLRDHQSSGNYWKKPWSEVGFKNIRRWLIDIGPENISLLRDLELSLSDGPPCAGYHRSDPLSKEDARFVHDGHVIECLRMLARHSRLRNLKLCCNGRKTLSHHDDRFISELKKVKVDTLEDVSPRAISYGYRVRTKLDSDVLQHLCARMERKEKLYYDKSTKDTTEPKTTED